MTKEKIIPLNLVMTYPVNWNKYKVFRDFIQNFYDSVDVNDWSKKFNYKYESGCLSMWIDTQTFSYEWLLHIGASTKTGDNEKYAGYFGEGFKIASLCATRDFYWKVFMESGHWKIAVDTIEHFIDGQSVNMLAYHLKEKKKKRGSCLTLQNVSLSDFELFKETILSFYYADNPLLGKKLWIGKNASIYERSNHPYPMSLPCTPEFGRKGCLFCSYQLLASIPFDLVINLNISKRNDRERNTLYRFDIVNELTNFASQVEPMGAFHLLERMKRYWNTTPKRRIDINSWYGVISTLVNKINQSSEVKNLFVRQNPNLLYLPLVSTIKEKNARAQAQSWFSLMGGKYTKVSRVFAQLGYPSLENKCEEDNGFVLNDMPDELENKCFDILEKIIHRIFKNFWGDDFQIPERRVITNNAAVYNGMATVFKKRVPIIVRYGIRVSWDVTIVYLKRNIFKKEKFFNAISTYIHELCHSFGGDASQSFSLGLTYATELLLEKSHILKSYEASWKKLFIEDS